MLGQGNNALQFRYIYNNNGEKGVSPEPAKLEITQFLGFQRKNSTNHDKTSIPPSPILTYSPQKSAIFLDFEFTNLKTEYLNLKVQTSGAFGNSEWPFLVEPNRHGKKVISRKFSKAFESEGIGYITIILSGPSVTGINKSEELSRQFMFEIISYKEKTKGFNKKFAGKKGLQDWKNIIGVFDTFADWRKAPYLKFRNNTEGADKIRNELRLMEQLINQRHIDLLPGENAPYKKIRDYYDLFGCWKYKNSIVKGAIIASELMRGKANDDWAQLDKNSKAELKEYQIRYCNLDCNLGNRINCDEIQRRLKPDSIPPGPIKKDPCNRLLSRAYQTKSIERLNSILSETLNNSCPQKIVDKIEALVQDLECEKLFELMVKELNVSEKRSLLNRLITSCPNYSQEAQDSLMIYSPITFVPPNKPQLLEDPSGRSFYRFSTQIESGYDIKLVSINSIEDSAYVASLGNNMLRLSWVPEDTFVKVKDSIEIDIYDIEQLERANYPLVFQSASGEKDTLTLTQREFKIVKIDTTNQQIIISVENGQAPYYAVFIKGKGLTKEEHRRTLVDKTDTISRIELGQIFHGTYLLEIRDKNGRELNIGSLNFEGKDPPLLWAWLIFPLLMLIGFLLYRNLWKVPI